MYKFLLFALYFLKIFICETGADPGFQVRGCGLKKNGAERREVRKCLGYFVWKFTILRKKIIFFPIFPIFPWIRPCENNWWCCIYIYIYRLSILLLMTYVLLLLFIMWRGPM